ncbi:MAG: hypothetical protein ABL960_12335 [Nitrospira sp.]
MDKKDRLDMKLLTIALAGLLSVPAMADAATIDPPCDAYPPAKQARCIVIWKELNKEDGAAISQFGLDQLKRREEGTINAQQHLSENMAFIKQSTEKRLARLKERMAKE